MPFVPDLIHVPVATPAADSTVTRDGSLVRSGRFAQWPDRCVVCNEPAQGNRVKLVLAWYPLPVYLLIFLALPLFLLAAIFLGQSAKLNVGLCDAHLRRRRRAFYVLPVAAPATVGACAGGLQLVPKGQDELAVAVMLCSVALLVAIAWAARRSRTLRVRRMKDGTVWAKCGPAFLESLPANTAS
jgi:hypothetical protein